MRKMRMMGMFRLVWAAFEWAFLTRSLTPIRSHSIVLYAIYVCTSNLSFFRKWEFFPTNYFNVILLLLHFKMDTNTVNTNILEEKLVEKFSNFVENNEKSIKALKRNKLRLKEEKTNSVSAKTDTPEHVTLFQLTGTYLFSIIGRNNNYGRVQKL